MVSRTPMLPAPDAQAAIRGHCDPYGPPSPEQTASVRRLIRVLQVPYGIETSNIISHSISHSDIKTTACSGKYFPPEEISQGRKDPLLGTTTPSGDQLRSAARFNDDRSRVVATPTGDLLPVAAEERNRP